MIKESIYQLKNLAYLEASEEHAEEIEDAIEQAIAALKICDQLKCDHCQKRWLLCERKKRCLERNEICEDFKIKKWRVK